MAARDRPRRRGTGARVCGLAKGAVAFANSRYIEVRLPFSRPSIAPRFALSFIWVFFFSKFSCFFGNRMHWKWPHCGREDDMHLELALGIRVRHLGLGGVETGSRPSTTSTLVMTGWQEGGGRYLKKFGIWHSLPKLGGTGGQTRDGGIQDSRGRERDKN
ncbi:hypothetical protein GMDG_01986 [Pseudogymnoascus destructans 20631-21]|uniref:Uncharacterized protein n=1 Tax=Pseudogymnoascus destructans (strain ATCC MYA-4855 / 20631-21) TaxID=658429 RepID=L8FZ59_PSED2|nr:hypothetical protein GMDG_01986 [Pseudogymnoascus destructans 20631-21]